MKYNFDKISERRNINSRKWDVKENELPMWVADMDFLVLPEIKEAIINAANVGSYGYAYPSIKFFQAYQNWWKKRHDLLIDTNSMVYVSGVVSALDSFVNNLTIVSTAWGSLLIFDKKSAPILSYTRSCFVS